MSKQSLIARRQIVQVVTQYGGAHLVPVTKELLVAASSARGKYQQYLEAAKEEEAAAKRGEKRKASMDHLETLKTKKRRLEADITHLLEQSDKLCEAAEQKESITLVIVIQANALRGKAKEKKAALAPLEEEIEQAVTSLKEI